MNYVCGFMMSWDLQEFLLIRKTHPDWMKGKWNGIGGKIETNEMHTGMHDIYKETPHETMIREFYEETGIQTTKKRWHCFHIEEFKKGPDSQEGTKVYYFAAFGDETKRESFGLRKEQIKTHTLIDVFWDQGNYLWNLNYLLHMIIYQVRKGFFHQLNPQNVNNIS